MAAKPLRTVRKRASAERCLRPLGATSAMVTPDRKTAHRFGEGRIGVRWSKGGNAGSTITLRAASAEGIPRIPPEGGGLTYAAPDASERPYPPAGLPAARSLAHRTLSAHSPGEDAAGTATGQSGSAACRSDAADPGEACSRGRGLWEASAGSRASA